MRWRQGFDRAHQRSSVAKRCRLNRALMVGIATMTITICTRQDPAYASGDKLIAEYTGYYVCAQGVTGLVLGPVDG